MADMMIVEKRALVAVLAAFAWIGLVYLWQSSGPGASAIDAPEASQVADLDRIRVATSIGPLVE
jgi:hypothetical protein